jgi:flavin reductase (DIM6/NTAB) family NADH-FMN oxidoreductase RutF
VLHDAGVRLSCVVHQFIPVGDHVLLVARVESVHHPEGPHEPLVWHDGRFAGIAPSAERAR